MDTQESAKTAPRFNGNDPAQVDVLLKSIASQCLGFRPIDVVTAAACFLSAELVSFSEEDAAAILKNVFLLAGEVRRSAEASIPDAVAEMHAYQAACAS